MLCCLSLCPDFERINWITLSHFILPPNKKESYTIMYVNDLVLGELLVNFLWTLRLWFLIEATCHGLIMQWVWISSVLLIHSNHSSCVLWGQFYVGNLVPCFDQVLCKGYPSEFVSYFHYCRSLRFEDKPDYGYLKRLFRDLFIREGKHP